jgi:lactose/L-arabinose transport system substrate-binding protein
MRRETMSSRNGNPLSRRDFLRLTAGAATAAILASGDFERVLAQESTPSPTLTPIPGLSGDVVVWGWTGVFEQFQAVIPQMKQLYPDVNVRVEEMSYEDTHTNILAAVNTGVGVPDVVNFDVNHLGEFGAGLADLTDKLQPYLDEIIPISVKLATYKDRILGVPQDSQPVGMFYRSDLFAKYGLNAEQILTYDDLIQAGKTVSSATSGEVKMLAMDVGSKLSLGDPHLIIDLLLVQNGLGGTYFNRDDDKVVVDTPEAIEAMEALKGISDPDVCFTDMADDAATAAYAADKILATFAPGWFPLAMTGNLPQLAGKWSMMRLPAIKTGGLRASYQIPTVSAIPKDSTNRDAAWELIRLAQVSLEAQLGFNEATGGIMPTWKRALEVLRDKPADYFGGQKIYALYIDIAQDIPDVWFGRGWPEARSIMRNYTEPVIRREQSPEEACRAAAEEMRLKLNKS